MSAAEYDYIIVGGGTAGCLVASELATKAPDARILMLEAGANPGPTDKQRIPAHYVASLADDSLNYRYMSAADSRAAGRVIPYPKGRGLGGSSNLNFMAWARGPACDYDEWALRTGDADYAWQNVMQFYRLLESFDPTPPRGLEKYVSVDMADHGTAGKFKCGFGPEPLSETKLFLEACCEQGHRASPDMNNGNPIGVNVGQFNIHDGQRVNATDAFLPDQVRSTLSNLDIRLAAPVRRVVIDPASLSAIGVEIDSPTGEFVRARREVVLCASSLESPKLLMLSGIGERAALEANGIQVLVDNPAVGRNMVDHPSFTLEFLLGADDTENAVPSLTRLLQDEEAYARAREQYDRDRSGPLSMYGGSAGILFPQLPSVFASREFADLSRAEQQFLLEPTRPTTEIWHLTGSLYYDGPMIKVDETIVTFEVLTQNALSRGQVSLRSRDPRARPVINPHIYEHPIDMRIAIESIREIHRIASSPVYTQSPRGPLRQVVGPPAEASDAELEHWVRNNYQQGFHAMGTCLMGPADAPLGESVVTPDFCVRGVQGLRVADLSVCPMLTCGHTQVNAYIIGYKASRAILAAHKSSAAQARL